VIELEFVVGAPFADPVKVGEGRWPYVPVRGQILWLESKLWADDPKAERGRRWFRVLDLGMGGTNNGAKGADTFVYAPTTVYLRELRDDEMRPS
jgi:hypothetical protein